MEQRQPGQGRRADARIKVPGRAENVHIVPPDLLRDAGAQLVEIAGFQKRVAVEKGQG